MIILALDPGSTNIGLSVLHNEELLYCDRLRLETKYEKFNERLTDITHKAYREFLRIAFKYQVTNVCWEIVPAIGGFGQHDFVVAVSVAMKILACQYELPWQGIAAITVKKMMTENHKATKAQMKNRVLEMYPSFKTDFPDIKHNAYDAFDSVLIGRAAMQKNTWNIPQSTSWTGRAW